MKKVLLVLLSVCVLSGFVWAGITLNKEIINEDFDASTIIAESSAQIVLGWGKIGFFVKYIETEVGNSIKAIISMYTSDDGSTWTRLSWYDTSGGTTLQATEEITSNGLYFGWLESAYCLPYLMATVELYNTDADDLATVTFNLTARE